MAPLENRCEDCKEGSLGSSDGEEEEEKACQDRLVRRLGLERANDTLDRGPTHPRLYPEVISLPNVEVLLLLSVSDEKPEALRGDGRGLQLTYPVVEPGFEPKSK